MLSKIDGFAIVSQTIPRIEVIGMVRSVPTATSGSSGVAKPILHVQE